MAKLYFSPGACSMSCHIAFEESGLKFEPIAAKWGNEAVWSQIRNLNPQEAVPVLDLGEGKVLTQNAAILTWIADTAPEKNLMPKLGSFERAKVNQWLSWVSSDLHPAFGPLFGDDTPEAARKEAIEEVDGMLKQADAVLASKPFITGDQFTVADAYLFTVYSWCKWVKLPQDPYKNLNTYSARIAERPAIQRVLAREAAVG